MAKSEGLSISNFMHQMLRVGHTEHKRTIITRIAPVNEENLQHFCSICSEIIKVLL